MMTAVARSRWLRETWTRTIPREVSYYGGSASVTGHRIASTLPYSREQTHASCTPSTSSRLRLGSHPEPRRVVRANPDRPCRVPPSTAPRLPSWGPSGTSSGRLSATEQGVWTRVVTRCLRQPEARETFERSPTALAETRVQELPARGHAEGRSDCRHEGTTHRSESSCETRARLGAPLGSEPS